MRLMQADDDEIEPQTRSTPLLDLRRFKDPIHDFIPFSYEVCAIIDTPQFQRLRNIKQLGTSYYVWPGASHNRFEHSLGVAHLAGLMAEHLQKSQPELNITRRDVKCVTIAGLCHDLGHGPWSHVWDAMFIPRALPGTKWKHEDSSDMMFDALIQENDLDISEDDASFIKALIAGETSRCSRKEKPFLFEIVANKRNGLDVDKFDYIARDTHAIDMKVNLSLTRLIHSARAINDEICYHIKDASQIYELCHTRFSLHKRVYGHKTAKAIEYMLIDALLAAEPYMKFARDIFDPKRYLYLTDDIRIRIEASESPELQPARDILYRIHRRDLYHMVDWKVFPWAFRHDCKEIFTPEKIVRAAQADERELPSEKDQASEDEYRKLIEELKPEHIIVDISMMHYGMKDKNPLDTVSFYSKHCPDKSQKAQPHDVSLLMPGEFGEVLLRIYTRDTRFNRIVRDAYNALLPTATKEEEEDPLADDPVLTPPQEEHRRSASPRKQRSFSRVQSASGRLISDFTPLSQNNFTAVPLGHGAQQPSLSSRDRYKGLKRDREDGPRSPPAKKKVLP
ncbi:uncharacterized protein B0H18DRAFT_1155264 [Fomitopsis serialis]|uniref:uncharacterized protein n=1 Tax=Fomitopsis serialis TaxID=139415 RepID=UPI002008E3C8|nr:uncharacterized protein B0H18DRAFT_1155264 [Neoantrodia serialis]KAH9928821.1 hypothetical protein B0H18DRAFT_1155264 [Neoantrodia serialis]